MNPKKHRSKPKTPHSVQEGLSPKGKGADEIEQQLHAAEEEAKNHYDKLLRVMAEFENFKKRIEKEKADHLQYSNEKLVADLLPILDDLDRVLDHIPEESSSEIKAIADGVILVQKNMRSVLEKYGLSEVPALGEQFDPNVHEAIATSQDEDRDDHEVLTVHRKGYKLNERLLRAALVTVNK
jgi:molecular chaperone GrpE